MNRLFISIVLLILAFQTKGQHIALTFKDAEKQGIKIAELDSFYKSAVHIDPSQAVFKTEADQQAMLESYVKLLKDLGKFLAANNFYWEEPTKCFNRVYFKEDGTIDYFLYNFINQQKDQNATLSLSKQAEFNRLLDLFIKDYKIPVTSASKFAQCGPSVYMPHPKEKK